MRHVLALALVATLVTAAHAQTLDKELVASLSGAASTRAIVSELLWDGGILIIQSAELRADDQPRPSTSPRPDRTWSCAASRLLRLPPTVTGS